MWLKKIAGKKKTTFKQEQKLISTLLDMQYFDEFGICADAICDKASGHLTRGFSGVTDSLCDVLFRVVFAEPGFRLPGERYSDSAAENARHLLSARFLELGVNQFHRNITEFLTQVFPLFSRNLQEQFKRVWLSESRHCSLAEETGSIGRVERSRCANKYFVEQIRLFSNAIVLLAGGKAR